MPDYRHALSAFLKLADESAEPVGAAPAGLELGIDLNLRHVNMRLDLADATLVEHITAVLGQPIPVMANTFSVGIHALYWLGPDEWQITTTDNPQPLIRRLQNAAGDRFVTLNDVSDGLVSLRLSGTSVRDTLAKGCTLDLHPGRFRPCDCAQTTLAKASMLIASEDTEAAFDIIVRRSFAEYVALWLRHAATEFGFRCKLA